MIEMRMVMEKHSTKEVKFTMYQNIVNKEPAWFVGWPIALTLQPIFSSLFGSPGSQHVFQS